MKKAAILIIVVALVYGFEYFTENIVTVPDPFSLERSASQEIENAFRNRRSDIQIRGEGTVLRILSDDLDGSKHQRIVLELDNGQSLLIAHNIDLAPRVKALNKGDIVEFFGEYEWNSKGGVIHWTHKDPGGRHVDGWLKHRGRTYQ